MLVTPNYGSHLQLLLPYWTNLEERVELGDQIVKLSPKSFLKEKSIIIQEYKF